MPKQHRRGKSIDQNKSNWNLLVFSKTDEFFDSFSTISFNGDADNNAIKINYFSDCDALYNSVICGDNKSVIHFNSNNISESEIIDFFKKIQKLSTDKIPYSVVWSSDPWEKFSKTLLRSGLVNDFRSHSNQREKRLLHIIYSNVQNQMKLIELNELKTQLESKIQQRTLKLTETNEQLQKALSQNIAVTKELKLHEEQAKNQNIEIQQRNEELEAAFKKSSIQHIQLQKALNQNETQRKSLEEALEEIQSKNDTLKVQNDEIIAQRDHIEQQHEEIQSQRDMALKQRDKIVEQQQEITDNILYSSRIQSALLPPKDLMKQLLPEHFVLNKPKDVVSGDFYWISQNRNKTIVTVGDCTGHGISGAMMSMLGTAFLNEIVNKNDITNSAQILEQLRERVISSLHQEISNNLEYSRDGMDISVCIIDIVDNTLEYSGANNPLYIFRKNELIELKPDKMPIGIHEFYSEPFSSQKIEVKTDDIIFLFTDGFADQFGGKYGKKLKYNRFKNILHQINKKPFTDRKKLLEQEFDLWRGNHEQIDDVMVLGFKIN